MKDGRISVQEYLSNKELLTGVYTPYDTKLNIVSKIVNGVINATGGLNTAMLRRISTEVFIETISNIDMSEKDENGLQGFDQLCYTGELDNLKKALRDEYYEFENILSEYIDDYIRIETNPAITISRIYSQITDILNSIFDDLSERIQGADIEKIGEIIANILPVNGGVSNEGK